VSEYIPTLLDLLKSNESCERLSDHLRRASVWLSAVDQRAGKIEIAGSAVAADIHGTKVLLTAGHVLREWERELEDGRLWLQAASRNGAHLKLRPDTKRLWSDGGDGGPDAGILVLPRDQTETYFQLGQIDPVRHTTLQFSPPAYRSQCLVAGYPRALAEYEEVENADGSRSVSMRANFAMYAAPFLEAVGPHHFLEAAGAKISIETTTMSEFSPGEMNRMSGCGFWTVEVVDRTVFFGLHGVHTATLPGTPPRLRETPIEHHVRLIAKLDAAARDKVHELWPWVDLDYAQS
jgi:hypothetical protein